MIAAPPSEAGALQDRVTWPLPGVPASPVGGPGFRIRAAGSRTAVRTTDTLGPVGPVTPLATGPAPADTADTASMAGMASMASMAGRRKGFMRTPGGVATRCQEDYGRNPCHGCISADRQPFRFPSEVP